jgi:hypothetical protein
LFAVYNLFFRADTPFEKQVRITLKMINLCEDFWCTLKIDTTLPCRFISILTCMLDANTFQLVFDIDSLFSKYILLGRFALLACSRWCSKTLGKQLTPIPASKRPVSLGMRK